MVLFVPQSTIHDPRPTAGGPRHMLMLDDPDGQFGLPFDRGLGGGRIINFDPISVIPQPIAAPTARGNAQLLTGGLTFGQLDQTAKFETQEGARIGLFYGRLLFGQGTIVSHLYEPGTPRNTFTVVLGEGRGGLGDRGEWERIVTAWYKGEALTSRYTFVIWFHDFLPTGATADAGQDGWNWIQTNPLPFFGRFSHQSPVIAGHHFHAFSTATQGLAIVTGDTLTTWVWIDPVNTPTEIMLEFRIGGDQEHRAYWGADSIALGTNGTNSRRQISASIPATGKWVRLDVPVADVGLAGTTIDGMAFRLFGGGAAFDQTLKWQSTMSGNTGYIFRPGYIAPVTADLIQLQTLSTWPSGVAYSGSANVVVRLNTSQSAEDRPDGFKCIAECRRTFDYDATGAEIGYGYSPNPARVMTDRLFAFFLTRFRTRPDLAEARFRRRINWPSWVRWRDTCAALIPWDRLGNGVSAFVPRFEFHGGFVDDLRMAQVLDVLCAHSATFWADDGEEIVFFPPTPGAAPVPVHHLHPGNIVRAPQRSSQALRRRPNRFIMRFRDIEDPFLGEASVEPPDNTPEHLLREDSINRVGEIRTERALGNMTYSQAQRLGEYTARIVHDNPFRVNLLALATAIHVLRGEFVTVSHPELGWEHQPCLVVANRIMSAESSAGDVEFTLQKINGLLYDDTYHRPRQETLTL